MGLDVLYFNFFFFFSGFCRRFVYFLLFSLVYSPLISFSLICLFYFIRLISHIVWAVGVHMDGTTKAWRQLFIASCTKWKACRCLFNHFARWHNYGFFKWILCASVTSRFLRGAVEPNGIRLNNANDIASSDMGTTCYLHSGLLNFFFAFFYFRPNW